MTPFHGVDEPENRRRSEEQVEEQHVGFGGWDLCEHLVSRRRLADDRHLGARRDEALESLADDQSIVGDQQPDHNGLRMTRPGGLDSEYRRAPQTHGPVEPFAGATGPGIRRTLEINDGRAAGKWKRAAASLVRPVAVPGPTPRTR